MSQKTIIITEKPSVAREYAKVLNVHGNKDGYIENDKYIITWAIGHLVTMSYPEKYDPELKKWEIDTLPFLPENYKYEVIKDVSNQFKIVKELFHRNDVDTILYAGDSGREGLYIQMLIREQAKVPKGLDERVVWIDSQTDEEILKGIKNAKPISAYENLKEAGYMRAIEDYATGINFSRILSIKYGGMVNKTASTKKYIPLSIGRVMTCVMGMVAKRDKEIEKFVPTIFYKVTSTILKDGKEIVGEWKLNDNSDMVGNPRLYKNNGFLSIEDAKKMMQSLPSKITIEDVKQVKKKEFAPLLFNLAELQAECTKRFKISPDETLAVAQSLYEKKLTTYPRTDARVLSSAVAKEIEQQLMKLCDYNLGTYADKILSDNQHIGLEKTKYVDDSKITDHYAIIPTGQTNGIEELSDLEKSIYDLIVRRFLAIFYPPAEYIEITLTQKSNNETFVTNGKFLISKGYLEIAGVKKESDIMLGKALSCIKKGEHYDTTYEITKGQTTPPKKYTSGSMIIAMENAGQLIEDEALREQIKSCGIGTSATRAEVIKKLVRLNYLSLDKKTQNLSITKLGKMIVKVVEETIPTLLNPEMTASWEKGLEQIASGKITRDTYEAKLNQFVKSTVDKVKANKNFKEMKEKLEKIK